MVSYYVSPTGNDANNGLTTLTPKATIPAAHTAASNGDTIVLMNGTHSYATNITITKNVSLTSLNGAGSTTLQFTVTDRFITFQDTSGSIISNITFDDVNANLAVLNIGFASTGVTKPTVWPTNNIVRGCVFNTSKYAISVKGENTEIYNNTITRKAGTSSISPFLIYFVRGYLLVDGNTWTDNINPSRLVYLTGFGTASSPYLNYINSRNGEIIVTNNTVNSNTGITSRTINFVIQDTWNTRSTSEAVDGLTASDVSTFRLSWKVTGNTINAASTGSGLLRVKGLVAFTTANDSNGNNYIQQWSTVYCTDNTFNCSGTSLADQGAVLLDDGGAAITITDFTTPKFDISRNIITLPSPFVARTGSTGDARFCQVNTVLPANLYTQPWVNSVISPPSYTITSDLFLLPDIINVSLTGTYETYVGAAGQPGNTSAVSVALTNAAASQIDVTNLPASAFKVIVGVSPAATGNSLWFFIRVFDDTGSQITTFTTPITIDITTTNLTGTPLTVELNGTTLITSAPEVSPGVYQFQLSSNSEYLLTGPASVTNTFPAFVGPALLAPGNIIVYTTETVDALVLGEALPAYSRVSWAPNGVSAGTLLKNLGRKAVVLGNNSLSTHIFIQIQIVSGPTTEGVGGAVGDYLCGWICSWAASGAAPIFT